MANNNDNDQQLPFDQTNIEAVIFDIGGVLLDWNPKKFLNKLYPSTSTFGFFNHYHPSTHPLPNSLITSIVLNGVTSTQEWKDYNKGTLSLEQAAEQFASRPEVNHQICALQQQLASLSSSSSSSSSTSSSSTSSLPASSLCDSHENMELKHLFQLAFLDFAHRVPSLMLPLEHGVEALRQVKRAGYKTFILSNFPKDNYLEVQSLYPWVFEWFDGAVVSFQVQAMKPHSDIYLHLLDKYSLTASKCIFIDDKQENLDGAAQVGIYGVPNTDNSIGLVQRLKDLGIL